MRRRPPTSTRTYTLFPYTTLSRSAVVESERLGRQPRKVQTEPEHFGFMHPARRHASVAHRGTSELRCAEHPRHTRLSSARSEEHTSELQSLMRISYAVYCLNKKMNKTYKQQNIHNSSV